MHKQTTKRTVKELKAELFNCDSSCYYEAVNGSVSAGYIQWFTAPRFTPISSEWLFLIAINLSFHLLILVWRLKWNPYTEFGNTMNMYSQMQLNIWDALFLELHYDEMHVVQQFCSVSLQVCFLFLNVIFVFWHVMGHTSSLRQVQV